jgi:hypothetical protein
VTSFLKPGGESGPQGPQGTQGIAGEQGAGLALQGSVATENDLPASSTVGFAYIVEASGDLYIWNGGAWIKSLRKNRLNGHVFPPER